MKKRALAKRTPEQMTITLPEAFGPVALKLPPKLPFAEWERIGHTIQKVATASKFWVGDFLTYGEQVYGEEYSQVMDTLGYSVEGLSRAMKVSANIAPSRRRRSLSWTHHALVANLEPDEQDRWLDKAVKSKWTTQQLRDALKGETTVRAPKCCVGCACKGEGCACAAEADPEAAAS